MKAYTDIEQSKKLAKILPIESADMYYFDDIPYCKYTGEDRDYWYTSHDYILTWSLGALLEFLPKIVNNETLFIETSATLWHVGYRNVHTAIETYLIDACYEMILKLHEMNLL